jgi:putative membrane protein
MMFGYGSHWALWQVALMWIGMVAFVGLLVWAICALVASTSREPDQHRGNEARHVLDQRLAKGEIDADEYRRLRDLIADDDRVSSGADVGR